ncbi:MAG: 4-phosphoerythronate dehydrogenase [Rikenellaceae bacterium]
MSKGIKVIVDDDIPFIKGILEPYATVYYCKGEKIGTYEIRDADALIIRTRTKCDASLLKESNIKFIASATIGSDHVDLDYCREKEIFFTNSAGCNAWGVVQYVLTAIFSIAHIKGLNLAGKTIGIIGAGNVGERLARVSESLGFRVLRCDPPVKKLLESGGTFFDPGRFTVDRSSLTPEHFLEIEEVIIKADIISLHIPLNQSTRALFNKKLISKIKEDAIFINSSRGEVVDESALIDARQRLSAIVIDVWNNEPDISRQLVNISDIATPHIAGYSLEGKINATVMVVNKFAEFFGLKDLISFTIDYPSPQPVRTIIESGNSFDYNLFLLLNESFPILDEDRKLKENPQSFEQIRSSYVYRREMSQELFRIIDNIKPKK